MKNLHLKLGIGIIVVFGALIAGFYLHEPLWFKIQEWRLVSDNVLTREAAAKSVADKGGPARPYIEKWLGLSSPLLVASACEVLKNTEGDFWKDYIEQLEKILGGPPSAMTDAVAALMLHHGFKQTHDGHGNTKYSFLSDKNLDAKKRNIFIYLSKSDDESVRKEMVSELPFYEDAYAEQRLLDMLRTDPSVEVRKEVVSAIRRSFLKNADLCLKAMSKALESDPEPEVRLEVIDAMQQGFGCGYDGPQLIRTLQMLSAGSAASPRVRPCLRRWRTTRPPMLVGPRPRRSGGSGMKRGFQGSSVQRVKARILRCAPARSPRWGYSAGRKLSSV
jgi:hypothetical protein